MRRFAYLARSETPAVTRARGAGFFGLRACLTCLKIQGAALQSERTAKQAALRDLRKPPWPLASVRSPPKSRYLPRT